MDLGISSSVYWVYELLPTDPDQILRSQVFPGLWLAVTAFWADDMAAVLGVLQQGLASPEHQAFLAALPKR